MALWRHGRLLFHLMEDILPPVGRVVKLSSSTLTMEGMMLNWIQGVSFALNVIVKCIEPTGWIKYSKQIIVNVEKSCISKDDDIFYEIIKRYFLSFKRLDATLVVGSLFCLGR